jgi:hypothetical protein
MRSRSILPVLSILTLLSILSLLAARPASADDGPAYYPLAIGTRWSYTVTAPKQKMSLTMEATKTEKVGDDPCTVVTTRNADGSLVGDEDIVVRPDGIYRASYAGAQLVPPFCILKFPVTKGETWKTASSCAGEKLAATVTVDAVDQEVTVPAGTFKCVVTSTNDITQNGQNIGALTISFAKDVGMVKEVWSMNGLASTIELTSFEAGPNDYYPLKIGTRASYSLTVPDSRKAVTAEATRTEKQGDETCTVLVTRDQDGKQLASEDILFRSDGIYEAALGDAPFEPPVRILELPVKKGLSWKVASKTKAGKLEGTFTIDEVDQEVTVPAGKFSCVVVSSLDLVENGQRLTRKTYFAKGVGLVKKVQVAADGTTMTQELTKLRPAAEAR